MNLSDIARRHAAQLEPPGVGAGVLGALLRSVIWVAICGWTLVALLAGGGWPVIWRVCGLWLALIVGGGYLRWFVWIWWMRLRGGTAYWTHAPSLFVVASSWIGIALIIASFTGGIPGLSYVHFHFGPFVSLTLLLGFYAVPLGIGTLLYLTVRRLRARRSGAQVHVAQVRRRGQTAELSTAWVLSIGVATGYARGRNDAQGCFGGDVVGLALGDASRGVLVSGAPGSGKTTLMRSFARQASLLQGTALVAVSAKRDDAQAIAAMCSQPILLGPGHEPFALFSGLSPAAIGDCFGQLAGDPRNPFWASAVANLVTAWMQILAGLTGSTVVIPEHRGDDPSSYEAERILTLGYTAESLSEVIYSPPRVMQAVLLEAARRLPTLSGAQHEQMSAGISYFAGEYQATLETARGETLGSVRASVSPYLRALTIAQFRDAFSTGDIQLSSAMDHGRHVIVDVDMAEYPQGFAVVSSFILAHLRKIALQRTSRDPAANNPCLLLCDEFGTYASNEHLALFETCRQSNIASVVSIIGLSNLHARLGEAGAYSVAAALASMLVFSTGDHATRKYMTERIGTVRVREITSGSSSGRGQTPFLPQTSYSVSEQYVQQPIIDDACWTNLGVRRDQGYATAVAILAAGGGVQHDVVMVSGLS